MSGSGGDRVTKDCGHVEEADCRPWPLERVPGTCLARRAGDPDPQGSKAIHAGHCSEQPALAVANEPWIAGESGAAEGEELRGCDLSIRSSSSLLIRAWGRGSTCQGPAPSVCLSIPQALLGLLRSQNHRCGRS